MSAECSWLRSYETAEREGIWTIQSSIFPENIVSVQLHQRHGFREVGDANASHS
jgi:L-amino acid N-acyltransferase YncA